MTDKPMTFSASATASQGIETTWKSFAAQDREVTCSIPKEFGGPDAGFSPEDFFIQALLNCYIATLKVIAQNSKMSYSSLEGSAVLTLDRDDPASNPWMKSAALKFTVTGVENIDHFRRLMERVSKQCMVLNSVKTIITFDFQIEGQA